MKKKIIALLSHLKTLFSHQKIKISLLLLLLTGFCLIGLTISKVTSQEEEIIVQKKFSGVPVKLVSVTAEKKEVSLEKPFAKTSRWYKGLEFEIENTSDKIATFLSLDLTFTRPKELKASSESDKYSYSMIIPYGDADAFFANGQTGVQIKPNEIVKIHLTENYYNTLDGALTRLDYPSKFKGVEIVIREVGFSDGTLWSYGLFYKQNTENPTKWEPILEKKTTKIVNSNH